MIALFFPFARDLTHLYKRHRYTCLRVQAENQFQRRDYRVTFCIKIPIDHASRDLRFHFVQR